MYYKPSLLLFEVSHPIEQAPTVVEDWSNRLIIAHLPLVVAAS
jgi:hypothetical protein